LSHVTVSFTWYVIDSSNYTFNFEEADETAHTFNVTAGNYTLAELATAMNTAAAAALAATTVTYSAATNRFTLLNASTAVNYVHAGSTIAGVIGAVAADEAVATTSAIVFTNPANIYYNNQRVVLASTALGQASQQSLVDGDVDRTAIVPLALGNFNETTTIYFGQELFLKLNPGVTLASIDFFIKNTAGTTIDPSQFTVALYSS
jgi:hypothetical protein